MFGDQGDGTGVTTVSPGGAGLSAEVELSSITIPGGKIGLNGWVDLVYATERTTGAGTLATRIRVGHPTTGAAIALPSAGTRIVAMASMYIQNSLTSHRSSAPANTAADTGTTTTATSAVDTSSDVTFYLTGVFSEGTDTATKYYFKATVNNPDA